MFLISKQESLLQPPRTITVMPSYFIKSIIAMKTQQIILAEKNKLTSVSGINSLSTSCLLFILIAAALSPLQSSAAVLGRLCSGEVHSPHQTLRESLWEAEKGWLSWLPFLGENQSHKSTCTAIYNCLHRKCFSVNNNQIG